MTHSQGSGGYWGNMWLTCLFILGLLWLYKSICERKVFEPRIRESLIHPRMGLSDIPYCEPLEGGRGVLKPDGTWMPMDEYNQLYTQCSSGINGERDRNQRFKMLFLIGFVIFSGLLGAFLGSVK
jgi:hypothetical protein